MSATHDQQYLADGITEEVITGLAKFPKLIVMTRNATLIYKDKPTDSRQVGKDLNVSYVVEGSVQRADQTVRVAAQLIDARTGSQLWADRYDRETNSIFAIRDVPSSEQSGGWAANLRKPRSHAWPGKTRIALLHTIT
jgi:adenylate cyclase